MILHHGDCVALFGQKRKQITSIYLSTLVVACISHIITFEVTQMHRNPRTHTHPRIRHLKATIKSCVHSVAKDMAFSVAIWIMISNVLISECQVHTLHMEILLLSLTLTNATQVKNHTTTK